MWSFHTRFCKEISARCNDPRSRPRRSGRRSRIVSGKKKRSRATHRALSLRIGSGHRGRIRIISCENIVNHSLSRPSLNPFQRACLSCTIWIKMRLYKFSGYDRETEITKLLDLEHRWKIRESYLNDIPPVLKENEKFRTKVSREETI